MQKSKALSESKKNQSQKLARDCSRSHPHENMDALCTMRTVIAKLENESIHSRIALKYARSFVERAYRGTGSGASIRAREAIRYALQF